MTTLAIGVAIGVPVAAALAYILFGPSSSDGPSKKKSKKQKSESKQTTPVKASPSKTPPAKETKKPEVEFRQLSSSLLAYLRL